MHGTRNYFAVKCLRKDKIVSDEDVQDTLTERKILTMGTNHPYLCHLFCTFQTPASDPGLLTTSQKKRCTEP